MNRTKLIVASATVVAIGCASAALVIAPLLGSTAVAVLVIKSAVSGVGGAVAGGSVAALATKKKEKI